MMKRKTKYINYPQIVPYNMTDHYQLNSTTFCQHWKICQFHFFAQNLYQNYTTTHSCFLVLRQKILNSYGLTLFAHRSLCQATVCLPAKYFFYKSEVTRQIKGVLNQSQNKQGDTAQTNTVHWHIVWNISDLLVCLPDFTVEVLCWWLGINQHQLS